MDNMIDLAAVALETNSPLWQLSESEGELVLQVLGNRVDDHTGGKVALIGDKRRGYMMQAEMRFLGHHLPQETAGWFGIVMRAQDTENYELVWFMPRGDKGETAAYLAVAHGVVPWWTEAYASQEKAGPKVLPDTWFRVRVDVVEQEFTLYMEDQAVFSKKLTYYLEEGRPGFYVGTATDAAFRRVVIEDLPEGP